MGRRGRLAGSGKEKVRVEKGLVTYVVSRVLLRSWLVRAVR